MAAYIKSDILMAISYDRNHMQSTNKIIPKGQEPVTKPKPKPDEIDSVAITHNCYEKIMARKLWRENQREREREREREHEPEQEPEPEWVLCIKLLRV